MAEIPNDKLTVFHLPAKWDDWNQFALTFNGYEALGHEECAALANRKHPKTLTEYRACLFFEARRWRHFGQPPDDEAKVYILSLLSGIRGILLPKAETGDVVNKSQTGPMSQLEYQLWSRSLEARLTATKKSGLAGATNVAWPAACRGSTNAWAVFVGPSPGKEGPGEPRLLGGPNRPLIADAASLGRGLGVQPFNDTPARSRRWAKLILACVGSEAAAQHLTALWNLDWGHYPDARKIPAENLADGAEFILNLILEVRPRVVVMLTNKVADTLIRAISSRGIHLSVVQSGLSYPPREARFPDFEFSTLLIKPPNHPSRHFLTDAKIAEVEEVVRRYR